MSTYFFVIFEMQCMIFRYNVCLEEYMDLSPRLISGTKSEHTQILFWTDVPIVSYKKDKEERVKKKTKEMKV